LSGDSDRETWLEARRHGVGASESAILLGASQWGSPRQIYEEKIGGDVEPVEETEQMRLGKLLEGVILDEVARRADVTIAEKQRLLVSSEHHFMLGTPDAITSDGKPVEVKNMSFGFDEAEWSEAIPFKYQIQVQHQMILTGAKCALFGALIYGGRILWEWVQEDQALQRQIVAACRAFWTCVERREPPPSVGHRADRSILARAATIHDTVVELAHDDQFDDAIQRYSAARERRLALQHQAKAVEVTERAAADELATMLGAHRSGRTNTGWRVEWSTSQRKAYTVAARTTQELVIKQNKKG
jgi:putative phage-type endonuclease